MSLAKKCDRCGAYHDDYSFKFADISEGVNGFQFTKTTGRIKNELVSNIYDLCPKCLISFEQWMFEKTEGE